MKVIGDLANSVSVEYSHREVVKRDLEANYGSDRLDPDIARALYDPNLPEGYRVVIHNRCSGAILSKKDSQRYTKAVTKVCEIMLRNYSSLADEDGELKRPPKKLADTGNPGEDVTVAVDDSLPTTQKSVENSKYRLIDTADPSSYEPGSVPSEEKLQHLRHLPDEFRYRVVPKHPTPDYSIICPECGEERNPCKPCEKKLREERAKWPGKKGPFDEILDPVFPKEHRGE